MPIPQRLSHSETTLYLCTQMVTLLPSKTIFGFISTRISAELKGSVDGGQLVQLGKCQSLYSKVHGFDGKQDYRQTRSTYQKFISEYDVMKRRSLHIRLNFTHQYHQTRGNLLAENDKSTKTTS